MRILHRPFGVHALMAMHRFICVRQHNECLQPVHYFCLVHMAAKYEPQRALSYLVGNPVVAWGGLAALIFCLWRFWKTAALPEGLLLLLFAANYLQWAVTPEKGLFYYYYYPAVMFLGVAIAVAFA